MIRKVVLAAFAAAIFSSGAVAAEYYVVQEKATKKCKVVETRPSASETTWVQVGPLAFKTREEADKQIAVICKEKN
jgi:hypothetical protein